MGEKVILIADDESHILHVVSMKLRNAGYRVLVARDGQEAYNLVHEHHPDLIITDYHMPGMSGLELCRKLRQEADTAHIPSLMLTARGYCLEGTDTTEYGIIRLLSKPFSPRQLLNTVHEVVNKAA
jgi:two-component system, OmpR family, alkaline phosphatase synthesis response regulator PhoP